MSPFCSEEPRRPLTRFSIITPVFNGARFIDETILSVVTQAGSFSIRYHIQDGGSTDGTLHKLERWRARLGHDFPILCDGIQFSYASELDRGLYDAIDRGFTACGAADIMSWINADDRYESGAFQSVAYILDKFFEVQWICGRVTIIDELGMLVQSFPLTPFPRKAIAAGLFDGRHMPPFIQQEGTFWRPNLWHTVGGINTGFRLAGDFDLWRRFAGHADLTIADATFGCWRKRDGQLSLDKSAYHSEIDCSLSPAEITHRAEMTARYGAVSSREEMAAAGFVSRVFVRRDFGDWACEVMPSHVFGLPAFMR